METLAQPLTVDLLREVPGAVEDPIRVRLAQAEAPGDLAAMIRLEWQAFIRAHVVVVDAGRLALADGDAAALSRLASVGARVVIAGGRAAGGAGAGFPPLLVLHEPAFARAAVASIYALDPWQTAVLVTPEPPDSPEIRSLVTHALRWRAAWQDPEVGDFGSRPA